MASRFETLAYMFRGIKTDCSFYKIQTVSQKDRNSTFKSITELFHSSKYDHYFCVELIWPVKIFDDHVARRLSPQRFWLIEQKPNA